MPQMSRFVPVEVRRAKLPLGWSCQKLRWRADFLVRVESWEIRKIIVGETTSNIFAKCKVLWESSWGSIDVVTMPAILAHSDRHHHNPCFVDSCSVLAVTMKCHSPDLVRPAVSASQNLGQAPQTLLTKHQTSCQRQPILSLRWKVTFKKKLAISTCLCRGTKNYSIGLLLCHCIMLYSCLSMLGCRANTTVERNLLAHLPRHYLEQVIVALHERSTGARSHVPYRTEWYKCTLADLPLVSFTAVPLKDSDVENACCQELDDDFSPSGFSWLESHDPCEVSSQQSCKFLVLHFAGGNCKTVMVGDSCDWRQAFGRVPALLSSKVDEPQWWQPIWQWWYSFHFDDLCY